VCTLLSDSPVNWAWGSGFSVTWTGYLYAPVAGTYTFGGWVDGNIDITIKGQIVADLSTEGGSYGGTVTLEGGSSCPHNDVLFFERRQQTWFSTGIRPPRSL
jgi:hypothetical protein